MRSRVCCPPLARVASREKLPAPANIVAEGEFRQVASIGGDEKSTKEISEDDAAIAFVRRQTIILALRIIEFLLSRFHIHIGVGKLSEINLGAADGDALHVALNGHV